MEATSGQVKRNRDMDQQQHLALLLAAAYQRVIGQHPYGCGTEGEVDGGGGEHQQRGLQ